MNERHIEVIDSGIRIHDLEIPRKDVADYLRGISEGEREVAFIQAVEVGVFCLERSRIGQETEFVRRQVEGLLKQVETAVGAIPSAVESKLTSKIGTGEGQVLAPILTLINTASTTATDRLQDVKNLLADEIDPAKETTTLGQALKRLKDLLDPNQKQSIQASLETAVLGVTAKDGALAEAVKSVVKDAVTPLSEEVNRLGRDIRGQEAAEEAIQQTIEKGTSYEEEVVVVLQGWAKVCGAEVHHVGADNRPGDILINLPAASLAGLAAMVVIEVKDLQSPKGRKAISDSLTDAMKERKARAAIYLNRSRAGLADEIGEWAEGECDAGPFVATTHEHLTTALRFLIVQQQLAAVRESKAEVDALAVEGQLERIKTALARVANINRKVTDVRGSADDIQSEAEALREEVRGALYKIEEALRAVSAEITDA